MRDKDAQALMLNIVNSMPPSHKRDYWAYRVGGGYTPTNIEEIDAAFELCRAGLMVMTKGDFGLNPVWLTRRGWELISTADYDEIEEQRREELRGDISGSW